MFEKIQIGDVTAKLRVISTKWTPFFRISMRACNSCFPKYFVQGSVIFAAGALSNVCFSDAIILGTEMLQRFGHCKWQTKSLVLLCEVTR